MSKEVLIQNPSSIDAVRKHEETANWPFREEAVFWYGVSEEMDRRFFNGLIYPDGSKVPAPVIAFDDLRNKNTHLNFYYPLASVYSFTFLFSCVVPNVTWISLTSPL